MRFAAGQTTKSSNTEFSRHYETAATEAAFPSENAMYAVRISSPPLALSTFTTTAQHTRAQHSAVPNARTAWRFYLKQANALSARSVGRFAVRRLVLLVSVGSARDDGSE